MKRKLVLPWTREKTARMFTPLDATLNMRFGNLTLRVVLHRTTWILAILPHGTEIGCANETVNREFVVERGCSSGISRQTAPSSWNFRPWNAIGHWRIRRIAWSLWT